MMTTSRALRLIFELGLHHMAAIDPKVDMRVA
jgi:hypothetical protein